MAIAAVLLFGSRAREDQMRGSDTDILLVTDDGQPRHVSIGHLSMFFYPWAKLQADAYAGDLFVCHIVREAKAVFDPEERLQSLRDAFKLRSSYQIEIDHAVDLGWFLVRYGADINPALVAKRMIWCLRTILIARSAEASQPVFAPNALANFSHSEPARELLSERHSRKADRRMRYLFQRFLLDEGLSDEFHANATSDDYTERFRMRANKVALQTFEQQHRSQLAYA
jgi:hypothetical protein